MVLEKTLESPLTARRSNQSILKEISPGCSLEGRKDLHYPDNHDGVTTDLEPDILEYEVGRKVMTNLDNELKSRDIIANKDSYS